MIGRNRNQGRDHERLDPFLLEKVEDFNAWTLHHLLSLREHCFTYPGPYRVNIFALVLYWTSPEKKIIIKKFYEDCQAEGVNQDQNNFLDIFLYFARHLLEDEKVNWKGEPYDSFGTMISNHGDEESRIEDAKALILTYAIFRQCAVSEIEDIADFFRDKLLSIDPNPESAIIQGTTQQAQEELMKEHLPWCYAGFINTKLRVGIGRFLLMSDLLSAFPSEGNASNIEVFLAPRINIAVLTRNNGTKCEMCINSMTRLKVLIALLHEKPTSSTKFLVRIVNKNKSLLSTRHNDNRLVELGIFNNDTLQVVEYGSAPNDVDSCQVNHAEQNGKSYQKKCSLKPKAKGSKKQTNKNTTKQVNYQVITKEDDKVLHSAKMTLVFEEATATFKALRQQLNVLALKKSTSKCRMSVPKSGKVDGNLVNNPSHEGIGGKPGKIMYSVLVGDVTNLYKSSKTKGRSGNRTSHQHMRSLTVDLHGHMKAVALDYLDRCLPHWVETAMTGPYPWVIPVNIVCGGGNQILSEAVGQWIRESSQVANRPKSFG